MKNVDQVDAILVATGFLLDDACQRATRSAERAIVWRQRADEQKGRSWHRLVWRLEGRSGRSETNGETDPLYYCRSAMRRRSRHVVTR